MPAQRKPVAISTMARMTVGTADSQACSLSAAGLFGRGLCLYRGIFSTAQPDHRQPRPVCGAWLQVDYAHFWPCRFLFRFLKSLDGRSGQEQKTAFNPMATMENRA